jgi:hypothetical protein
VADRFVFVSVSDKDLDSERSGEGVFDSEILSEIESVKLRERSAD